MIKKQEFTKKQNFPALRDENCNREEPVQKPSRIFSWRSGHQPERSFFPRTRFRIPCSVRLTGILRTDTDKTDMVRLSDGRAEIHLSRSSNGGLQEEYFQHAPNSEESVGGTSDGLDVPVEHPHELHPCAHSCCQKTGINCLVVAWSGGCGLGGLVLALLFLQRESAAHLLAQARSPRLGNMAVASISAPK